MIKKTTLIFSPIDYIIIIRFIFQTFVVYTEYNNWQTTSAECKLKHNSYLFGNVDLTNPSRACTLIQGQPQGPSWLGIAKELYISTYDGKYKMFILLLYFNLFYYFYVMYTVAQTNICIKQHLHKT